MREAIARHYGGHPFEEKYACLTDLQTLVLYRQALFNKKTESESLVKLYIRPIIDATFKKIDDAVEFLSIFINPKGYEKWQEMKRNKDFEQEISEQDLEAEFFKLMAQVPKELIVEDTSNSHKIIKDDEFTEQVTGWISDREKLFKKLRGEK